MYRRSLATLAGSLFLVFTLVVGYIYYGILKNPEWLGDQFQKQVTRYFRSQVEVQQVTADHAGGLVRILGLRVADQDRPDAIPFIEVGELRVQHTATTIDEIDTIHLIKPRVHIETNEAGEWNFLRLMRFDQPEAVSPGRLPKISLSGATLHVSHSSLLREEKEHTIRRFHLNITPNQKSRDYTLRGRFHDTLLGECRFHGNWNLDTGQVRIELVFGDISISEDAVDQLRPDLSLILSRIGPRSRAELRATLNYDPRKTPQLKVSTNLHFWSGYAHWGPFSFAEMNGSAEYSGGIGGELTIGDLVGRIGQAHVRIRGRVSDVGKTNGFHISFRVDESAPDKLIQNLFPDPLPFKLPHFGPKETLRVEGTVQRTSSKNAPVILAVKSRRMKGAGGWNGLKTLVDLQAELEIEENRTTGQATMNWQGFQIGLEGSLDRIPDRGVAIQAHARGIEMGPQLYDLLAPRTKKVWNEINPRGPIDLTLAIDPPSPDKNAVVSRTRIDIQFQGIQAYLHDTPYELEDIRGTLQVRFPDIKIKSITARHGNTRIRAPSGTFRFHGPHLVPISLDVEADDIDLDEELFAALKDEPRQFIRKFRLSGEADGVLKIRRDRRTGRKRIVIHGQLREVAFRHKKFPFPIRDCSGTVLITDEEVSAAGHPLGYINPSRSQQPILTVRSDLKMRMNEGSEIQARIHLQQDELRSQPGKDVDDSRFLLDIDARGVRMTQESFAILSPKLEEIGKFEAPNNLFDMRIEVYQPWSDPARINLSLHPRNISILPTEFPYPIDSLDGEIHFDETGIGWARLQGRHGQTLLTITSPNPWKRDRILSRSGKPITQALDFSFENVTLDESFRQALSPSLQKDWDQWSPTGKMDLNIRLIRERSLPLEDPFLDQLNTLVSRIGVLPLPKISWIRHEPTIDAFCRDVNIQYEALPYPLQNIRGRVHFENNNIDIPELRGRHEDAEWALAGGIRHIAMNPQIEVHIAGRKVPLDDSFRKALSESQQALWDQIQPQGHIDIDARIQKSRSSSLLATRIQVIPHKVTICASAFPYPLTLESGKLVIGPGTTRLKDLRATHGSAVFEGSLQLGLHEKGSKISGQWTGKNIPLDNTLRQAVESYRPGLWEKWKPSGSLKTVELSFETFLYPDRPNHTTLEHLLIVPTSLTLDGNIPLRDFEGTLTASGSQMGSLTNIHGHFLNASWTLRDDLSIKNVKGQFKLLDDNLWVDRFYGELADGTLRGHAQIQIRGDSPSRGEVRFHKINIAKLTESFFPEEESRPALAGKLGGRISLRGFPENLDSLTGNGWIEVQDGHLWELPIFIGIFDIFSLPRKSAFHHGELEFTLSNRSIDLRNITFESSPLKINGGGVLDLEGQTDLYFVSTLAPRLAPRIPVLSGVWKDLKKNILPLHISGDIRDPSTTIVPLRFVQKKTSHNNEKE